MNLIEKIHHTIAVAILIFIIIAIIIIDIKWNSSKPDKAIILQANESFEVDIDKIKTEGFLFKRYTIIDENGNKYKVNENNCVLEYENE